MNRAKFSLLLGTLLCCLLVAALPRTGLAQALSKAVITYPIPSILSIDLQVAKVRGFFREEGLDAQLVMVGGNVAVAAAMAGDVQAVSNVASTIRAIERGNIPFKVLSISWKRPLYWLTARPEIKSIADLKGKLYGTASRGNAPHVAAARLLRKGGLDPEKDITVIITGSPFQSLVSGTIQAAAISLPSAILARDKFKMNVLASAMEEYLELSRGIAVR
ncbi:MAG: ABC transporter substrate-binding protein, partial [Deltaproteobacteria bacterium]|nr:ABC transporter substrate-binding protein [Deltaproteobacteria bacterium]